MLTGIFPPLTTPFIDDEVSQEKLAENILKYNPTDVGGYIALGSNGESVFLTRKEKLQIIESVRKYMEGSKVLIAGTGSDSIKETIQFTNESAQLGAQYALVITPFYYKDKMIDQSLISFYTKTADSIIVPLLIYNVPKFTGVNISVDAVAKLSEHENIIGIKNSSEDIDQLSEMIKESSVGFSVLAGSASILFEAIKAGASGGIVALADIAPAECVSMVKLIKAEKLDEAFLLQKKLLHVNKAITSQYGIAGMKAAMDLLGYFGGAPRLPILPLKEEEIIDLKNILTEAGLLS